MKLFGKAESKQNDPIRTVWLRIANESRVAGSRRLTTPNIGRSEIVCS